MKLYDFREIKNSIDLVEFVRDKLNMPVQSESGGQTMFNSPLRQNSDSGAFAVKPDLWYDHVVKVGGSVLDLVIETVPGCSSAFDAAAYLGELYHLQPQGETRPSRQIDKVYRYCCPETGTIIHETVRWIPKSFSQRRPDPKDSSKWINNLNDIEPILYRIKEWSASEWVCIVGGEKDADNLLAIDVPATTNAMGEGNWKDHYAKWFAGKHVVILRDNDEAGRVHGNKVAVSLASVALSLRIVDLPDLKEKGDVSDWLEAGGDKAQLTKIIKDTPEADPSQMTSSQLEVSAAKKANEFPFSNYHVTRQLINEEMKTVKVATHINDLVDGIFKRFHGFPRRVGYEMFDHDRKTGEIRPLRRPAEVSGWIAEKSGKNIMWNHRIEGAVTMDMLFAVLQSRCDVYQMISGVPNWPKRDDVYYTYGEMPEPTSNGKYFEEFCRFFNPATTVDARLLRAMVASPLYYRPKVDRPLWIIDSEQGQGVGKTKLVEMIAYLYGGEDPACGEPLWINFEELNSELTVERVHRRLLSANGRKKRIFLLDNVVGFFKSSALATLVTQGSISGMPPYGKGEETRTNDLTYIITSNSATVCRDLASRAFFVVLQKPQKPLRTWETEIQTFIRNYRSQIIADIIGLLERGTQFELSPQTRFKTWEMEVLAPLMGDQGSYEDVIGLNKQRLDAADGEAEEADTIRAQFIAEMEGLNIAPGSECVWIESGVISNWCIKAIPNFGGQTGRNAKQKLSNMSKAGMIPELSTIYKRFPSADRGKTGMMWNIEHKDNSFPQKRSTRILSLDQVSGAIAVDKANPIASDPMRN